MPGITSTICVPKEAIADQIKYCYDVNYDFVCVPVEHFLWPVWSIEEKDYQINSLVMNWVESRLLLELSNPMTSASSEVAGLELTSSVDCYDSYKSFTCRYNFPYCDGETGEIFKACPADCSFFHQSCGMSTS